MSPESKHILEQALRLSPVERAELVEQILSSFEFPDRERINALWAEEAEERIDAYDRGEMGSSSAKEILERTGPVDLHR
jgi:putative addiction module component (TIGR02574 family)